VAAPKRAATFYFLLISEFNFAFMAFTLTILGSNSALPTSERYPTAQVLNVSERFFLIDCGEGTQMKLLKYKVKFTKINHIFISHLHGDHCFGLIGLFSTFGLLGRKSDLHLFAHSDLETLLKPQLNYFCADLPFKIVFNAINPLVHDVIYEDKHITVSTIPLKHRIPTCGFLFKEKKGLNHIRRDMVDFYKIPVRLLPDIKNGEDFYTPEGEIVGNDRLTTPAAKARSYAFCSDTGYTESIVPIVKEVDLLYHEATFLTADKNLARQTLHSTASDAAKIAQMASVGKLILGHFSTRYYDLSPFELEAREFFNHVELAREGSVFSLPG
jgi:ribonuclease Z